MYCVVNKENILVPGLEKCNAETYFLCRNKLGATVYPAWESWSFQFKIEMIAEVAKMCGWSIQYIAQISPMIFDKNNEF